MKYRDFKKASVPLNHALIIELNRGGLSNVEIVDKTGYSRTAINKILVKHGLSNNRKASRRANNRITRNVDKYNLESNKIDKLKKLCNQVKNRAKGKKLSFNLDADYIINQYKKQRGECFYSDKELLFSAEYDDNNISLDKIVPENGYVKGNVVFCTARINRIKSDTTLDEMKDWMPGWHKRITEMWRLRNLYWIN